VGGPKQAITSINRHRLALAVTLAVLVGVAVLVALARSPDDRATPGPPPAAGRPVDSSVTIDGSVRFQRIDGFGTSERVIDDPHVFDNFDPRTSRAKTVVPPEARAEIYDKLYRDLKLTRVRPVLDGGVEQSNDNADPNATDRSRFAFAGKRTDAHIDYTAEAAARGLKVHFASPVRLETWMESSLGTPAEYTEWAMAMLHRWRSRGYEPRYYAPINEPGYYGQRKTAWQGSDSSGFSAEYLRDVVRLLGRELRADGFSTQLVIPDDLNPSEANARARVILSDPAARRYVGAIATHLYGDPSARSVDYAALNELRELAGNHELPLWMTEYYWPDPFGWAEITHKLLSTYGVNAIDYLWGFLGQWQTNGDQLITITHDPVSAAYSGYRLEKQYYVFGQFSRFIAPGARRIKADASDQAVNVTAYSRGRQVTIVAHNTGSAPKNVRFTLKGLPTVDKLRGVRTSGSEDWGEVSADRSGDNSYTLTLPAESLTSLAN